VVEAIENVARRKCATAAQVALAWILARRPWIVPIPGTTKLHRAEENLAAAEITFTRRSSPRSTRCSPALKCVASATPQAGASASASVYDAAGHPGRRPAIANTDARCLTQYFPGGQLEPILNNWRLPEGELYLVTPTARTRPAKVSALADFLIAELTDARWSAQAVAERGQMAVSPQRHDLDHTVYCVECHFCRHEQPTPDHRRDAAQTDLELIDNRRCNVGHGIEATDTPQAPPAF